MTQNFEKIKILRKSTNAGLSDCHNALAESNGDLEEAVKILRKKLLLKSDAKLHRESGDGIIGIHINETNNIGIFIVLSSETDFIAKNEFFCNLANNILEIASVNKISDKDEFLKQKYKNENHSIEDEIKITTTKLNENIQLKKYQIIQQKPNEVLGMYVHEKINNNNNLGKKGAIVILECENPSPEITEIANKIAMHIIAMKPIAATIESFGEENIKETKKQFLLESANLNKPQNIIEKIIDGMMQKYYAEHILSEQFFILEEKIKVIDLINREGNKLNTKIKIKNYISYSIDN